MKTDKSQIYEVPLDQIRPAPWNPPSRLDPATVRELADTIKREGQKSAALIRPVEAEAPVKYEIVFGHRRYAAKQLLATEVDALHGFLRVEIEEMSEERAMIIAGIENLQREGFSDVEEAEFFRTCGERYGESAVKMLSEKLSVSDRYVRKRIEILKLPESALALWRSGTWHVGHMEQLLRLGASDRVLELLEALENHRNELKDISVYQFKDIIDRLAVPLHAGNFDKGECKTCRSNADAHRKLFGGDTEKGKCTNPDCFKSKQQAWLDVNWATCKLNRYETQRAVIGDWQTHRTGDFGGYSYSLKPAEKCKSCPQFASIIPLVIERGQHFNREQVCMGDTKCFAEVEKASKQEERKRANGGKEKEPDAPRVAWHGEHFRQEFYRQQVPELVTNLAADDNRRLQVALAGFIYTISNIHLWFYEELGYHGPKEDDRRNWFRLSYHRILNLVRPLSPEDTRHYLTWALVKAALPTGYGWNFTDEDRQALAEFLDIDFDHFQVTEEYLKKKTKAELVRFIGKDSGLMEEQSFLDYLQQRGKPSELEKLAQEKKPVLIELIQNCGVDLHGRLPKEIADLPKLAAS